MGRKIIWMMALICVLLGCFRTSNYAAEIEAGTKKGMMENQEEEEETQSPSEPGTPEEPAVAGYEISSMEADGKNGFYRSIPEIIIQSKDEYYHVKYCVTEGEAKVAEGEVGKLEQIQIDKSVFKDGNYRLAVWLENSAGEEVLDYRQEKEYRIDTVKPYIQVSAPSGFETWYKEPVSIESVVSDAQSGMEEVRCYVNGKLEKKGEESLSCTIRQESAGGKGADIRIEAVDLAGNRAVKEERLFLDLTDPVVTVEGFTDFEICAVSRQAVLRIQENNLLSNKTVRIVREQENGSSTEMQLGEWKMEGDTAVLTQTLEEDGIYKIEIAGEDRAGRTDARKMQVIIDKSNPVIDFLEQMGGKVLKEFAWDYDAEEIIKDFTSYDYEVKMDGRNYLTGEKITREGAHTLRVWARDAAGNESEKTASFLIDRTTPEIIIEGAQEEELYNENVELKIQLKDKADWVEQILINGEEQKLSMEAQIYRFACEKEGMYKIQVTARDIAGNEAVQKLHFQIEKPKGIIEKVMTPLKTVWKSSVSGANVEKQNKKFWICTSIIIFVLAGGAAGGIGLYRYRKNR